MAAQGNATSESDMTRYYVKDALLGCMTMRYAHFLGPKTTTPLAAVMLWPSQTTAPLLNGIGNIRKLTRWRAL